MQNAQKEKRILLNVFLAQAGGAPNTMVGLKFLAAPIARKYAGGHFHAEKFCTEFEELYGVKLHRWTAQSITEHLLQFGLLTRCPNDDGKTSSLLYVHQDLESTISEATIKAVVAEFIEYSKQKPVNQMFTDEQLEEALFDRLTKIENLGMVANARLKRDEDSQTLKLSKEKEEVQERSDAEVKLDIAVSSFVMHVRSENHASFEILSSIVSGLMLKDYVDNIQDPETNVTLKTLSVVLDTKLLMMYLGLDSREDQDFANEFISCIQDNGADVYVFPRTLVELKANLRAVVSQFETNPRLAHGPTAQRLWDSKFKTYVQNVMQDPEKAVKAHKIRVIRNTPSQDYFDQSDIEKFKTQLPGTNSVVEHDVACLSDIVNLRRKESSAFEHFYKSRWLFITTNTTLAKKSEQYLIHNSRMTDGNTPPIVTFMTMSGLLWVLFGSQKTSKLPKLLLIANCVEALGKQPNLVEKVHKVLSQLDPAQADMFDAVMLESRAVHFLSEYTGGDPDCIDTDNVMSLIDGMKQSLIEEERLKSAEELKKLEDDFKEQLAKTESELKSSRDMLLSMEAEAKLAEDTKSQLARQTENLRLEKELDFLSEQRWKFNLASKLAKLICWLTYLVGLALAVYCERLVDSFFEFGWLVILIIVFLGVAVEWSYRFIWDNLVARLNKILLCFLLNKRTQHKLSSFELLERPSVDKLDEVIDSREKQLNSDY